MSAGACVEPEEVRGVYERAAEALEIGRKDLNRPLRLTDKLLISHVAPSEIGSIDTKDSNLTLRPDRLAMPDSSAQMALLQFISTGRRSVAIPTTIHCDHLIRAKVGSTTDLAVSEAENEEVYEFLASASAKYGIGLWAPGSGIIHQVILERYAYPGGMLLGADSHTPNAGGMGMLAIGAGGAQAVDLMVGQPYQLPRQRVIGIELTGQLHGFASAKDVILLIAKELTVRGGTGAIIEYFGDGASSLSTTGRATICNMGAELGATTSVFPADDATVRYLEATGRADIAGLVAPSKDLITPDQEVVASPQDHYDQYLRIDLDELEPQIVGPHSPDRGRDLSQLRTELDEEGWPAVPAQALVGSCTNSSYEDMGRAAHVARQAIEAGMRVKVPLLVTPGSETIRATIERDGLLADLEAIGATVLANACGPCIGQWDRTDVQPGQTNSIITSYNRNFPGRNDGSSQTLAFIASPEVVVAMALAGTLDFDPARDHLTGQDGAALALTSPESVVTLPELGFAGGSEGFLPPVEGEAAAEITVSIREDSDRLQLLDAFPPWTEDVYRQLPILLKVDGKCTTDHISPAGVWLRYRGHLDRISDNLFTGAVNAFADEAGWGIDQIDGSERHLHEIARRYRSEGLPWVVIGHENYGEGSSREHAAMEPRHLGCIAVVALSFARIHEMNLKKHGILPLTFVDPTHHEQLGPADRIDIEGLSALQPGEPLELLITPSDGSEWSMPCMHTLTESEIEWFRAGSALNSFTRTT